MNKRDRDRSVIKKILKYCGQVEGAHKIFNKDRELFFDEETCYVYRNAIAMPIFQIGELTNSLSDELRSSRPDIPWRGIYEPLGETVL